MLIILLDEGCRGRPAQASRGGAPRPADYVFVDWGPEVAAQNDLAFPELSSAGVFTGLGPLGPAYLLAKRAVPG